jgi:hypothetical protein
MRISTKLVGTRTVLHREETVQTLCYAVWEAYRLSAGVGLELVTRDIDSGWLGAGNRGSKRALGRWSYLAHSKTT